MDVSSEPLFDEVAGAILDGTAIDWNGVDSRAGLADQPLVEQLKTLAALRLVARRAEPRDAAPDRWGHLRVLERIGTGAFGEVYRAWDTRLDREVALKLLPSGAPGSDSPASSIIEEGRLLARVRHPNVVTIYGAERIDGRIGLWMEFIKGRTLEQAVGDGKTFTPKEVTRIGVDLCRAVSAVHAAGLIHRDVKAQNVMVADDGRLVLMDFGTGLELDAAAEGHAAGTPLYLAPEVLAGGAADARSDVYSAGVVLYRLLTGSYPVQARDLAGLRSAHAARGRSELPADSAIPPRLHRVIARALDPDPARRYASAGALGDALAALERVPLTSRAAYAVAAAAAVVAIASAAWNLGARDLFTRKSATAPLAPAPLAPVAPIAPLAPTIAVLPFKNLSSEPDSDYFVDGLTSEVIRNLAVIDGLQVRSQTSSFFFKDRPRDLHTIGEQLGVNLVVEADVQRVGNRLRVNAQLVRIDGDVPLWSERFDRTLDDVFAIQDEISRAIVNKLRLTLGKPQRRYQTNLQAYELYLRGQAVVARGGNEGGRAAAKLFSQVIVSDPGFAPAHAGLARAYAAMSWQLSGLSNDEGLAGMRPAAMRALELDPLLAEAHAAMGATSARELDWEGARKSFERALQLNPNLPFIYLTYSNSTLLPTGQAAKAQELAAAALVMDPLSLAVRRELALTQFVGGRYEDTIDNARKILAIDPNFQFVNNLLCRALTFAGHPEEAIAARGPADDNGRWLAHAYVMAGRRAEMDRMIALHRNEHPYRQALVYAALGDKDRTFAALDRAVDLAPQRTALLLVVPEMAFLRGDPRLEALRKRLKLP